MAFVKYTNTGSRMGAPKISIWSRGQIGFNQAAAIKYNIKSYRYVVLYFDSEEQRVGIRLTNDSDEEGIIKLIVREDSGASFSAVSFLRTYNLFLERTKNYTFEFIKDYNMFVFKPEVMEE